MNNEDPGISGKQHIDAVNYGLGNQISSAGDGHDICYQTGEEFSAEFLRDRVALRRIPVIADTDMRLPNRLDVNINDNNCQLVYEDLKHALGLRRADSDGNSDLSEFAFARGCVGEVDNRNYPNNLNRYQFEQGGIRSGTFSKQLSGNRFCFYKESYPSFLHESN